MKKILVLAGVLVVLAWGLSFAGTTRYAAPFRGDVRIHKDPGTVPANGIGPGPFAMPGTAVFLDSSRNQFGIYVERVQGTSASGASFVGKVIRQYLTSSGILECFTWTNSGRPPTTFTTDPNLNDPAVCSLRYPHAEFDAPDGYGFVTAPMVISTFDAAWYIRNSGGYGSGIWDAPVQITPSGTGYQNMQGTWLGSVRPWTIGCTGENTTTSGIPLEYKVIDTLGNEVQAVQTIFDQNAGTYDFRNGKYACFGGGPSDNMNLKTSTDGGATWQADSIFVYAMNADSGWYEWNNVICQDGTPAVLLTMDNTSHTFASQHSAIQFFKKGHPKVTVFSPNMFEAAAFPQISRKDDNTLVALFEYCPTFDSVAWSNGRTFWDLAESHSTDGGATWSAITNLTNTPTVGECCPQLAKHIGSDNHLHITYGTCWRTSQPGDTADLYWAAQFQGGATNKTYNYYYAADLVGVEGGVAKANLPKSYELAAARPNPANGSTAIQFALPAAGPVKLAVYNAAGQLVKTLVSGEQAAGVHSAQWDARGVPSGVYFYSLKAGTFNKTRTVVVVR